MKKLCKNCRHWKDETLQSNGLTGVMPNEESLKYSKYCGAKFMDYDYEGTDQAWAEVTHYYEYAIRTGPDFGCVHFEEKK